jgi:predicted regulator of Ras-like GTPase activity (Roadblock/LC7/MglB family)
VDIEEQEKISAFALLSTYIRESSFEIGKPFNLSDVESVLVEGKNVKVLCMSLGENKLDVFMEKSASDALVTKRILS